MPRKPPKPAGPFEVIGRTRVHDGFLKLDAYRIRQHLFRGGLTPEISREVVMAHEAVAVLCFDPVRDEIVTVEQGRLPAALVGFAPIQTEIVAGIMEPNEPPEEVAVREVLEETGLHIQGALIPITHMVTTPGHSTEHVHVYCARVDTAEAGGYHGVPEEHEDIRIQVLASAEFFARLGDGRIANSFTLVAGFWLMLNLDKVRAAWR